MDSCGTPKSASKTLLIMEGICEKWQLQVISILDYV